jgi:hypothetical protein
MRLSMRLIVAGSCCFVWASLGLEHSNRMIAATFRRNRPLVRSRGSTTQAVECSPPPRSRGMYC